MKLDVHVCGRPVAQLYREREEYVLKYLPGTAAQDFVSLTMPVRGEAWRWPRDLHPFFRQNLPEGYLLGIIREEFGPWLDGTDLSLLERRHGGAVRPQKSAALSGLQAAIGAAGFPALDKAEPPPTSAALSCWRHLRAKANSDAREVLFGVECPRQACHRLKRLHYPAQWICAM